MVLSEEVALDGKPTGDSCECVAKATENHLVHAPAQHTWKELHRATGNGNTHLVKQLLQQGAPTESR